jgi:hypothetical protein
MNNLNIEFLTPVDRKNRIIIYYVASLKTIKLVLVAYPLAKEKEQWLVGLESG